MVPHTSRRTRTESSASLFVGVLFCRGYKQRRQGKILFEHMICGLCGMKDFSKVILVSIRIILIDWLIDCLSEEDILRGRSCCIDLIRVGKTLVEIWHSKLPAPVVNMQLFKLRFKTYWLLFPLSKVSFYFIFFTGSKEVNDRVGVSTQAKHLANIK